MKRAPRPCSYPGCSKYQEVGSRCKAHENQLRRSFDAKRETAAQRGYGSKWREASKGFLRKHPLCQCPDCDDGRKRITPATVVDHRVPHRNNMTLFWDRSNWQSMAKRCHDRKTAREDGGGTYVRQGGGVVKL